MPAEEILVPAVSAIGGGVTVGWVAKLMIQNWIKRNDANHDKWGESTQAMMIQLTRIEEQMKTLQRTEQLAREQDRTIAVLQIQLTEIRDDLNGVGRKVRSMEQS